MTLHIYSKQLIILLLNIILFHRVIAENINVDSLKHIWHNETLEDSSRLEAIKELIFNHYLPNEPDSAVHFGQLQYNFSKTTKKKKHIAKSLNYLGFTYLKIYDMKKALSCYKQSLKIFHKISYKKGMISSHIGVGAAFSALGNYMKAKDHYNHSLRINKEINNKGGLPTALQGLSHIYLRLGDNEKAINYLLESINIYEENKDSTRIAMCFVDLGSLFFDLEDLEQANYQFKRGLKVAKKINNTRTMTAAINGLGSVLALQKDYARALTLMNRSLTLNRQINYSSGVSESLHNIGTVHKLRGDLDEAIKYYKQSLNFSQKNAVNELVMRTLNNIGNAYLKQYKTDSALFFLRQAYQLAKKTNDIHVLKKVTGGLYRTHKTMGSCKLSLQMLELHIESKDSILTTDAHKELIKYEYQKQVMRDSISFANEQEITRISHQAEIRQKTTLQYITYTGILITLIFIGIYLILNNKKNKAKEELMLQEIKLLKTKSIVKLNFINTSLKQVKLDKEKIETAIEGTLNKSDWKILNLLFDHPSFTNAKIAEQVHLSDGGVRSSLRKMYQLFDIEKSSENQRLSLIVKATRLSYD